MKIGLVQSNPVWEDRAASRDEIRERIESTLGRVPVDWLILPEMTLSGFSPLRSKTTIDEEDLTFFRTMAQNLKCRVTFGAIEDGINKGITLDADGIRISEFHKTHLFSFAHEDRQYVPGSSPTPFNIDGARVAGAVCYDLRFPYVFSQIARDTDVYVVIANWPESRADHWNILLRARAIENQAFVIGVNRIGEDPRVTYFGGSQIIDPWGSSVCDASLNAGVTLCEIDVRQVELRRNEFPTLRDRRADIEHR